MSLFKKMIPQKDVVVQKKYSFLKRLAELLREGYTFHDSLVILMPHYMKQYEPMLDMAERALRGGLNVTQILETLGFKRSHLLSIAVAEVDGTLTDSLDSLADRLKRKEERAKKIKGLLLYPAVLFVFMAVLLLVFRQYFLPNLQMLAFSRKAEEGIASLLPVLVSRLPDLFLGIIGLGIGFSTISIFLYRSWPSDKKIKILGAVPFAGAYYIKLKTMEFSSELGSLLGSGLPIQSALDILEDQQLDDVIGRIAETLKHHIIHGVPLEQAVVLTEGLVKGLQPFVKHGADTGHLAKELLLYSDQLNEEIEAALSKWISFVQPALFSLLAVCILAAYLAMLLPVYGLIDTM